MTQEAFDLLGDRGEAECFSGKDVRGTGETRKQARSPLLPTIGHRSAVAPKLREAMLRRASLVIAIALMAGSAIAEEGEKAKEGTALDGAKAAPPDAEKGKGGTTPNSTKGVSPHAEKAKEGATPSGAKAEPPRALSVGGPTSLKPGQTSVWGRATGHEVTGVGGPTITQQAPNASKVGARTTANGIKAIPPGVISIGGRAMLKPQQKFSGVGEKVTVPPGITGSEYHSR